MQARKAVKIEKGLIKLRHQRKYMGIIDTDFGKLSSIYRIFVTMALALNYYSFKKLTYHDNPDGTRLKLIIIYFEKRK